MELMRVQRPSPLGVNRQISARGKDRGRAAKEAYARHMWLCRGNVCQRHGRAQLRRLAAAADPSTTRRTTHISPTLPLLLPEIPFALFLSGQATNDWIDNPAQESHAASHQYSFPIQKGKRKRIEKTISMNRKKNIFHFGFL